MWNRYLKERVKEEQNHEMNAYKAEVVTNNGDGTLTVKRPFESVMLTLKAASSLQYAQPGDMVLVVGIGDKSKALSNAFILCKTDMTDDTDVPVYGMGENLLDNWYFIGGGSQLGAGIFPINQRGQTSYTAVGYGIDRWYCQRATHTLTLYSDYMRWERITTGYNPLYYQVVKVTPSTTYTFSILYRATFRKIRETCTSSYFPVTDDWSLYSITFTTSSTATSINVGVQDASNALGFDDIGKYIDIKAMKLELGTQQTLAHKENGTLVLNKIPDYWKEISTCQRYLKTITAWTNIYAIRVDNNNVYFFIPGQMAQNPSTLSSQAVYIYSSSGTNYSATENITFTAQSDGVMGQFARGSVPGGSHGSLTFSANAFISAE